MRTNKTMIQFFEWYYPADGSLWKFFESETNRLLQAGFTMAWLPPAHKGTRGRLSEGYDVYDIYDLGEFNQKGTVATKYGHRDEYVQAINSARQKGLQVCIDVVLNHMGGAEQTEKLLVRKVDPENREKFISEPMEIEGYTRFEFPGRAGKYSTFIWDKNCFTGIDHAVGKPDDSIYSILNEYGDKWETMISDEKGNFDYLMLNDIETRNPAVREELKKWIRWYYDTIPFDGVRMDAVKHINPDFYIEWLDYVKKEINPDVFAVGEFWLSDDLPVLQKYIDITGGAMSLFDAPLNHNLAVASRQGSGFDLRAIFDNTLVSVNPERAVTFVDNHDTQPLQALEDFTEQWFKPQAYALILLREGGYPCVFFADWYGTRYSGINSKGQKVKIEIPVLQILPFLVDVRKRFAYGPQVDHFDDAHCIGWTRLGLPGMPGSGCAVLISNLPKICRKKMWIGKEHSGRIMVNRTDTIQDAVVIEEDGYGLFYVLPMSVAVYLFD